MNFCLIQVEIFKGCEQGLREELVLKLRLQVNIYNLFLIKNVPIYSLAGFRVTPKLLVSPRNYESFIVRLLYSANLYE